MKPALLVIDMQQCFYANSKGAARESWDSAIAYINAAIGLFKAKGHPVYVIEHVDESDGVTQDLPDFGTVDAIKLDPSMPRVRKTTGSVFASTELEKTLRASGVTALVVTGYCAEWCVLSTTRHAADLGLGPMILEGAIASGTPERIKFVTDINDTISFGALSTILK